MKRNTNKVALASLLLVVIMMCYTSDTAARSQPQHHVQATLNFSEYDVVYLADFVNIRSQQLNPNISGISLDLTVTDTTSAMVCIYFQVFVQLQGETNQELAHGFTNNFSINGSRTLAARDFAKGGSSEVYIRDNPSAYWENKPLRDRLQDMATNTPTAPPGKYTVIMKVLPPTNDGLPGKELPDANWPPYGGDTKTILIPLSTPDGVFVEINDPKDGSFFSNLAPTFSWTTGAQRVTVCVYEAGSNNRSPQDALTGGNPNLIRDLSGTATLTYPSDAQRQLQQDKAYVLQIKAIVVTNRSEVTRSSRPVVFRITDDKVGQWLDAFLNNVGGAANATYTTLRTDPSNWVRWSIYGNITLDGSTLTETDLQTLLNSLAAQTDLNVQLSVENQ